MGPSIYHRVKLLFSFGVNRIVGFLTPEKYEVRSSFVSAFRTHPFVREEPINNTKHKRLKSTANNAIANRSTVTCNRYCVHREGCLAEDNKDSAFFKNGTNSNK